MKEAAGEANMTVITIILIAVVLGIGTVIVKSMMDSSRKKTNCAANGGVMYQGNCCYPTLNNTCGQ